MDISWILFLIITYFAPSLMDLIFNGYVRAHVFLVNFLLGWTVVAWVYCLIWVRQEKKRNMRKGWHDITGNL